MTRRPWSFLSAAALAGMALFSAGASAAAIQFSTCSRPDYPRAALQRGDSGISLFGFLVRADGTPVRSFVVDSSGYKDLDEAAREALMKCRWKPRDEGHGPAEEWNLVTYIWNLDSDPDMNRAKNKAALAANKGDVAARYRISRLLGMKINGSRDLRNSLIMLRNAAELGHAPAQFDLGRHYEKGEDMPADIEEALRWYRKAADQGNVFAIQRLETGFLPE